MDRLSIISIAPGTMPADTIADTTSPASAVESKKATSVRTASGAGTTRSMILVATPSVPSEPTNAPDQVVARACRRPCRRACTTCPSASTTSSPVT